MWKAQFETRAVEINVYGKTKKEAERLVIRAWKTWSKQSGADFGLIFQWWDDVQFWPIKPGTVFFDNEIQENIK